MPPAAKNLLLIVLIPLILAAGHDIYLNYFSDNAKIQEIKNLDIDLSYFMMSDLGWIWQNYSPSSMEAVKETVAPETWETAINPVLKQTSILVAIVPFLASLAFLGLTFLMGIWPFSKHGKLRKEKRDGYGVYRNAKEKTKVTFRK